MENYNLTALNINIFDSFQTMILSYTNLQIEYDEILQKLAKYSMTSMSLSLSSIEIGTMSPMSLHILFT